MAVAATAVLEALLGPFALLRERPGAAALLLVAVLLVTGLSQIGGAVLWVGLPVLRRLGRRLAERSRIVRVAAQASLLVALYALASLAATPLAASMGRVPLPCGLGSGETLGALSPLTCALNRHYATPSVRAELLRIADDLSAEFPGIRLSYLDAGFPFFDGFVLPPHLTHGDGRKVDLALLFVAAETGRPLAGRAPSPIGYWGYVPPRPDEPAPCAGIRSWLRWDFDWLQPLLPRMELDQERTAALLARLGQSPLVSRIFLEAHLQGRLGAGSPRVRFQGCGAARHDDHIHVGFR